MDRVVLARWESKRGKDWLEVYQQTLGDGTVGCGYHGRGCGGWLGSVKGDEAVSGIQKRVDAGCFSSQKTPMRRVV